MFCSDANEQTEQVYDRTKHRYILVFTQIIVIDDARMNVQYSHIVYRLDYGTKHKTHGKSSSSSSSSSKKPHRKSAVPIKFNHELLSHKSCGRFASVSPFYCCFCCTSFFLLFANRILFTTCFSREECPRSSNANVLRTLGIYPE